MADSGGSPTPHPSNHSIKRRVERFGLDIQHIEWPTAVSDITSRSHTLYIVEQPLAHDTNLVLNGAQDIAIVGTGEGVLPIPETDRDYDINVDGASFYFDLDIDQTARGAWGRINVTLSDTGYISCTKTGDGRHPDAGPDSYPGGAGVGLYPCATTSDAEIIVQGYHDEHNGVIGNHHMRPPRPIGIWLGQGHNGITYIENSHVEGYPNNGLYASAIAGTVIATNSTFAHNGVSNGRIARGAFINCLSKYDADEANTGNSYVETHATQGLASEAKKAGRGGEVAIENCRVEMGRVGKCGGGIDVRAGHGFGRITHIKNTEVHISDAARQGDEATQDIMVDGTCELITGCRLSGSAASGVSIWNNGPKPIQLRGTVIDYPAGRRETRGDVR